jgi:F-type H+-transporting ATPase subunit b
LIVVNQSIMNLLHQFGVNYILLAAQIINFLIVLWILKKFLYKPVLDTLKNRRETIAKGLKDAEDARLMYEKAEEREKEILRKAQAEAKKLLEEAKKQHVEMLQKASEDAKSQADTILKEAREQIAFEAKETEKRLSGHISQLAVQFLQKSLENAFTDKEQEVIMAQAMKSLKTKAD